MQHSAAYLAALFLVAFAAVEGFFIASSNRFRPAGVSTSALFARERPSSGCLFIEPYFARFFFLAFACAAVRFAAQR
jgi:hypothetical protein